MKKKSQAVSELNAKATAVIQELVSKGKDVYKEEDAKSLPVSTLKLLCQWKQQKKIPAKKDSVFGMWKQVRNLPPAEPSWRDSDEAQMQNLKEEGVTIRERDRQ